MTHAYEPAVADQLKSKATVASYATKTYGIIPLAMVDLMLPAPNPCFQHQLLCAEIWRRQAAAAFQ